MIVSVQIVILKLRQKTTVTAADHDQRHWKAAKVIFCHKYLLTMTLIKTMTRSKIMTMTMTMIKTRSRPCFNSRH